MMYKVSFRFMQLLVESHRALRLVQYLVVAILKFLTIFEHGALYFHFSLSPMNYIPSPDDISILLCLLYFSSHQVQMKHSNEPPPWSPVNIQEQSALFVDQSELLRGSIWKKSFLLNHFLRTLVTYGPLEVCIAQCLLLRRVWAIPKDPI